jgi:hypothetical protein
MGARPGRPSPQAPDLRIPPDGQRSGVLILGARRGDVFVATEVLISADSLSDEEAIRTWLAQHDIPVGPPCRNTASTHRNSTGGNGP